MIVAKRNAKRVQPDRSAGAAVSPVQAVNAKLEFSRCAVAPVLTHHHIIAAGKSGFLAAGLNPVLWCSCSIKNTTFALVEPVVNIFLQLYIYFRTYLTTTPPKESPIVHRNCEDLDVVFFSGFHC